MEATEHATKKKREIVDAAVRCIERFGASKVVVADIAKEVGVSRQIIYRHYRSREDILVDVILLRLGEHMLRAKRSVAQKSALPIHEKILLLILESMNQTKQDDVILSLIHDSDPEWIQELLLGDESPIQGRVEQGFAETWRELFQDAREQGVLRNDKSDAELADWIRHFQFLILWHGTRSKQWAERMIRDFLFPAIFSPFVYWSFKNSQYSQALVETKLR